MEQSHSNWSHIAVEQLEKIKRIKLKKQHKAGVVGLVVPECATLVLFVPNEDEQQQFGVFLA